ncbi:MAG: ABC transporter ATP-binding protein [Bacteroidetes bacterium]|nr:ABC transporter ATP-binding protein [Bacteroidota bacterium]
MEFAIETHALTHRFGKGICIPDQLNLRVPAGSIYGFLGQNGAGKTTVLRLLLGLVNRYSGSIRVLGDELKQHRLKVLQHTGALIESPAYYPRLTAAENLRVLQQLRRVPQSSIAEVLEITGLAHTGHKKVSQFSLGMKQRLGIAAALLHNPQLLILDEPTNGLDPGGIIDLRGLLRQLNRETGITIVVSSHLLAEIDKLATHAGVLHQGKLLFQGPVSELHSRSSNHAIAETSDNRRALEIAAAAGLTATQQGEILQLTHCPREQLAAFNAQLHAAGISVFHLAPAPGDLESVFIQLTQ